MKTTDQRDARGRPLVTTEEVGGRLKVCVFRYPDMTEMDKQMVRAVWDIIEKSGGAAADAAGNPLVGIEDYLNFKDDPKQLCG